MHATLFQLCLTLCNPTDNCPPGSCVHGILQARILEKCEKWKSLSCVPFFATPWTIACQARLSMEFSRPEYWSGLPFPSPGDLPNPGIEPKSPAFQVDWSGLLFPRPENLPDSGIKPLCLMSPTLAGRLFTTNTTWEVLCKWYHMVFVFPWLSVWLNFT